jgi:hypothetical protein
MIARKSSARILDEAYENKQVAGSLADAVHKRTGHRSRTEAQSFYLLKEQKTSFYRND